MNQNKQLQALKFLMSKLKTCVRSNLNKIGEAIILSSIQY